MFLKSFKNLTFFFIEGLKPQPQASLNSFSLDFELKLDLKFVRIYFDTTTFDTITKDREAKFVDNWRNYGAFDWIFYHQWSGDPLLWDENYF